jgi:hypothetical protein
VVELAVAVVVVVDSVSSPFDGGVTPAQNCWTVLPAAVAALERFPNATLRELWWPPFA